MKLSTIFAAAALGFGFLSGASANEMSFDIKVKVTTAAGADTDAQVLVDTEIETISAAVEDSVSGGPSRRHLSEAAEGRELSATVNGRELSEEQRRRLFTYDVKILNPIPRFDETEIPCTAAFDSAIQNLMDAGVPGPYTCFEVELEFEAFVSGTPDEFAVNFCGADLFTCPSPQPYPIPGSIVAQSIQDAIYGYLEDRDGEFAILVDVLERTFDVEGDPHFKTWSGAWYDYMGACDMKLMHAPHFDGEGKALDIDIRTKLRYEYSYVESAAVKLGDDVLEMGSFGDYFLNGVSSAKMPATVGGYKVTYSAPSEKIHKLEINLGDGASIVLKSFKDMVGVTYNGINPSRFRGALGMAGSYDLHGKLIGRDGVTEFEDNNAFANEWQIRQDEPMLFVTAQGPQHPQQCELPKPKAASAQRRLGETLAREKAERACAHFTGQSFEMCVFDVMATGDLDMADAGAY